jgi:hypothetical protein
MLYRNAAPLARGKDTAKGWVGTLLSPANHYPMQRTALYAAHLQAGGRMVPFAGWEMPVQYAGILQEPYAVCYRWDLFEVR